MMLPLCEREGALPNPELQQRHVFEDIVRPMAEADRTVLFLVDAMRFEMATELVEMLGSGARLRPRLAELPSVTEIGMNALAPVAPSGKLRPVSRIASLDPVEIDSLDRNVLADASPSIGHTAPTRSDRIT